MKQIGKKIIRLESVDSTNNYTANLIKEGNITHGTVILAVEQFEGRGQRNAEWLANPGENLTISIFLDRVNLSVGNQFDLTKVIALSVVDYLQSVGIVSRIKWPNDIFVDGRKIAGILIENSIGSEFIKSSIVGIGLNINQNDFPDLLATSTFLETGIRRSIDEVLFSLIGKINENLFLLNNKDQLDASYLEKLYLIHEPALFEIEGEYLNGVIKGVGKDGKLQVMIKDDLRSFGMKEIRFILQSES